MDVFWVCLACYKHERGWENSGQLPVFKPTVCITVENSPNPGVFTIRLCKYVQEKSVLLLL